MCYVIGLVSPVGCMECVRSKSVGYVGARSTALPL